MEYITVRDISLSPEESRDIIEFIAKKRNVNNCSNSQKFSFSFSQVEKKIY